MKVFIVAFFIIMSTASCFQLRVFNLNTFGNSWFDDLPIPSEAEPYNISSVKEQTSKYMEENYPNPALLGFLQSLEDAQLIGFINDARKKKERFEAICNHLKTSIPDVVLLQEVWYRKDYDFLKQCLSGSGYHFSSFDPMCGSNPVSLKKHSNLLILRKYFSLQDVTVEL